MTDKQIEAVGTAEDIARAAYQAGFGDGWSAARMVIEVLAQDEKQNGGAYGADAMLQALDKTALGSFTCFAPVSPTGAILFRSFHL